MLPWLIGGGVIAAAAYLASDDDEECRWCDKKVYKNGLCRSCYREDKEDDRRRAEESAQREAKRDENRRIESEIKSFKETSRRQIENKYGVKISFSNADVNIVSNSTGKLAHFKDTITQLDDANRDIENLIADLQKAKNEV